jgi:glyoxylase-like metal-dependent hydrolase (beta-lactamase superfamily II)
MIVERSMLPGALSNAFLVADRPGGHAVLIDAGAPPEPLLLAAERLGVQVTHLLCTHAHIDHIEHVADMRRRLGCLVGGHPDELGWPWPLDLELVDGRTIETGELRLRALHVPGHTRGSVAISIGDAALFSGDTLFRGSVGGTRGSGCGTLAQLKTSVLDRLLAFPAVTVVYPGHAEATTVGAENTSNPFVRAWRGDERPEPTRCVALGRPGTLLLRATDYDGGTKCWVRFDADSAESAESAASAESEESIVAGSRVTPA